MGVASKYLITTTKYINLKRRNETERLQQCLAIQMCQVKGFVWYLMTFIEVL